MRSRTRRTSAIRFSRASFSSAAAFSLASFSSAAALSAAGADLLDLLLLLLLLLLGLLLLLLLLLLGLARAHPIRHLARAAFDQGLHHRPHRLGEAGRLRP